MRRCWITRRTLLLNGVESGGPGIVRWEPVAARCKRHDARSMDIDPGTGLAPPGVMDFRGWPVLEKPPPGVAVLRGTELRDGPLSRVAYIRKWERMSAVFTRDGRPAFARQTSRTAAGLVIKERGGRIPKGSGRATAELQIGVYT